MADLIQNQIMFKGYDPQNFVIFLFGGGGPEFGAEYSKFSGVKEAIMLYKASTFSAFGIGGSDVIYTKATTELHHMPTKPEKVNNVFSRLEISILNELKDDGFKVEDVFIVREASLRYGRQVNYVNIPVKGGELNSKDMDQLMVDFENRYEAIYGKGSGHRSSGIELVNFRVYASIKTVKPVLMRYERSNTSPKEAFAGKRNVFFEDRFIETNIYRWENLRPGNKIEGPAIIEAEFTTGAVPQNVTATVDDYLNIHLLVS
jgi:N-methylhydantoinase A